MLKKLKQKVYYYLAEKNWGVRREYVPYVKSHPIEHKKKPLKHWWMLFRLNIHYRVLRKKNLLYPELVRKPAAKAPAKAAPARRLPYLQGAESFLSKRSSVAHLAKKLSQYDVVSFDIFDTLILRPFAKPADLFMLVGKRLKKVQFHRIRTDAEKLLREIAFQTNGNREVTIDDIYAYIEERTGIPKELGIQTEFQTEMDFCFANPYMKRVFDILKAQGKTVIIVSDMYFPHDMMEKLLHKVGYKDFDKLYVSCDYSCSKRSESLYRYVMQDFEGKSIIHVGDNVASDINAATNVGLATHYYKNVHAIGNPYRADGMSELMGSAYAGVVNTYLHADSKTYNTYYEYGFLYGGFYVLGFCNWMHKKAKAEGIDKILFLARDGDIYTRVFNQFYDDVPNEYFLWSRIANTKYTLLKNKEDFLRRVIYYRTNRKDSFITLGSMLESLSLEMLAPYMPDYNLSENTLVVPEHLKAIERLFLDHWDLVLSAYDEEKEYMKAYLKQKVGDAKNIAIVDVGWLGSGPMGLKYLIEDELKMDCKVHCWQTAARSPNNNDIVADLLEDNIEVYLFSAMYNRGNYDTHKKTNKGTNNIFFEMFTQSKTPSFSGWDKEGNFVYDIPEVENYWITEQIHEGILAFVKEYTKRFGSEPLMMNIPGYDAYLPYRMIIRDLTFIKKYFSKVSYARGVSGDSKKQKIESLGGILKQVL